MKSKSLRQKPATGPILKVGTRVVVKRPNLWSGSEGEVISVTDGYHRIKITGFDKAVFHADVMGDELEVDL
jgi:hypothetical protein